MMQTVKKPANLQWLLAMAGPVFMGGVSGMPFGTQAFLIKSLTLPVILFGLSCLMIPALYIGTSILGTAPSIRELGYAVKNALFSCGILLLGLVPLGAFLLVTTSSKFASLVVALLLVAISVLSGLRRLYLDIYQKTDRSLRFHALFVVWSLISLGIGMSLFTRSFEGL